MKNVCMFERREVCVCACVGGGNIFRNRTLWSFFEFGFLVDALQRRQEPFENAGERVRLFHPHQRVAPSGSLATRKYPCPCEAFDMILVKANEHKKYATC